MNRNILPYERIDELKIIEAIRVSSGEFIVVRRPFRWMKNGEAISNAYESFGMECVCEDNGWKIVEKYGEHIAICKKK